MKFRYVDLRPLQQCTSNLISQGILKISSIYSHHYHFIARILALNFTTQFQLPWNLVAIQDSRIITEETNKLKITHNAYCKNSLDNTGDLFVHKQLVSIPVDFLSRSHDGWVIGASETGDKVTGQFSVRQRGAVRGRGRRGRRRRNDMAATDVTLRD